MKTYYIIQDLSVILTGTAIIFAIGFLTTKKKKYGN